MVRTPFEESREKADPVFPDRMAQASAVSEESVIAPTSVPTDAVSNTGND